MRGYTSRQIADLLATRRTVLGDFDPNGEREPLSAHPNGKPWSHVTIADDIKHLENQAQQAALQDTLEHRNTTLEQLDALITENWDRCDLSEVRQCLDGKRRLLGLDKPEVIVHGMLNNELDAVLDRLEAHLTEDDYERISNIIAPRQDSPQAHRV